MADTKEKMWIVTGDSSGNSWIDEVIEIGIQIMGVAAFRARKQYKCEGCLTDIIPQTFYYKVSSLCTYFTKKHGPVEPEWQNNRFCEQCLNRLQAKIQCDTVQGYIQTAKEQMAIKLGKSRMNITPTDGQVGRI